MAEPSSLARSVEGSTGPSGSIGGLLARGRRSLTAAGCDTPRLDAELLLAEVLDPAGPVGRERLVIDRDLSLDGAASDRFEALLARRVAREPVAYILRRREFRHLTLAVDERVLIPRPETELLVEVGLELGDGARVTDVGTGCGAVALALKDERPDLVIRGTDVRPEALAVACSNARSLGLEVQFALADLLDGPGSGPPVPPGDAVLANLPYVPSGTGLAPEIARYEPASALFGGPDGLSLVRRLIAASGAVRRLSLLALEIAPEQAEAVTGLMRAAGWRSVEVRPDLAGQARVVVGRR